jgi:hypothetical protein
VPEALAELARLTPPRALRLATRSTPDIPWARLILPAQTGSRLDDLIRRVRRRVGVQLRWGMGRGGRGRSVVGLLYGESGTGKTLAAEAIATRLQLPMLSVDLSLVVSKYIGETEKNLSELFAAAEGYAALLFFDEADALFGRRTNVQDAHDRYANIEVNYLLQRLESFEGCALLATNLMQGVDDAFLRRFDQVVHFPRPGVAERIAIWRAHLPAAHLATKFRSSSWPSASSSPAARSATPPCRRPLPPPTAARWSPTACSTPPWPKSSANWAGHSRAGREPFHDRHRHHPRPGQGQTRRLAGRSRHRRRQRRRPGPDRRRRLGRGGRHRGRHRPRRRPARADPRPQRQPRRRPGRPQRRPRRAERPAAKAPPAHRRRHRHRPARRLVSATGLTAAKLDGANLKTAVAAVDTGIATLDDAAISALASVLVTLETKLQDSEDAEAAAEAALTAAEASPAIIADDLDKALLAREAALRLAAAGNTPAAVLAYVDYQAARARLASAATRPWPPSCRPTGTPPATPSCRPSPTCWPPRWR